jgi:hypothetical protein
MSYKLGKPKPTLLQKALVVFIALGMAYGLGTALWASWLFRHMTSEQHLWEAKKITPDVVDIDLALRHLSAIPSNTPEAEEAQVLKMALQQKRTGMEAVHAQQQSAQAEKQSEAKTVNDARVAARDEAASQLGLELRNLGYELSVSVSTDIPEEIVITASELGDTDHRVRFLSFMRGKNSPASGVCLNGFSKIRLRASQLPFVGFDETYSLNCFSW